LGNDSPSQDFSAPFALAPERPELDRYLEDTIVIDWQTPAVLEKARALAEGRDDDVATARAMFEFVRDEIAHAFDIETDAVTCSASQVLEAGSGLCYARCHLLVALLRARGLPAGFGYQRLRDAEAGDRIVLHGFAAVRLGDPPRWIALDPHCEREGLRAELDLDAPSLACAPDAERGEETIPVVFARPARRVVDLLDQADSLARIRTHLPDRIA
jgi:transglutaminase-like putative cysteine protease